MKNKDLREAKNANEATTIFAKGGMPKVIRALLHIAPDAALSTLGLALEYVCAWNKLDYYETLDILGEGYKFANWTDGELTKERIKEEFKNEETTVIVTKNKLEIIVEELKNER